MNKINLQKRTRPLPGRIETYWFENEKIGLKKTLYHRIEIPLEPFDSGLDYVEQPEKTNFIFEWYNLRLSSPNELNGMNLNKKNYPDSETSIYIGSAHNWCDVKYLRLKKVIDNEYKIEGELNIDFQTEGIGKNEKFKFNTKVKLEKTVHNST